MHLAESKPSEIRYYSPEFIQSSLSGRLCLLLIMSYPMTRLLMRVKEESEKADLKLNIQKTKIMASGHNTSWQIEGEKVENSDRFYFLGFPNHCGW